MQKTLAADDTPALDPQSCNCLAIRQAARHVTQFYDGFMAPSGLSASQYSILSKLSRLGPQSINALAAQMVMDRTTTGRAIKPLERDALVVVDAGSDARTRRVRLTAAGEKRVKAAAVRWRAAQRAFEKAYGANDAALLRRALSRAVTLGETGAD